MEDYKKKYEESLKKASELHRDYSIVSNLIDVRRELEEIFPELKESEDERIRKRLLNWLKNSNGEILPTEEFNACIAWLEKQGEQKPADKIESKFKVGDWVVTDAGKANQVIAIDEDGDGFTLDDDTYFSGSWKDIYHLWTIQDAKDGDVLAEHETIVLFKKIEGLNIKCYCTYHYLGFNPAFYVDTLQNKIPYHPATKEQRDLLFQKMKESGYEWDAEKKELKIIDWSKHIKYEPNGPSILEENQEWNEEDNEMMDSTIEALEFLSEKEEWAFLEDNIIWLKSLKPQPHWKPSEEQLQILHKFTYPLAVVQLEDVKIIESLYSDLKKL